MALINCPECQSVISSKAYACPQCGMLIDDDLKDKGDSLDQNEERVIAEYKYSMIKAGPFMLVLFMALIFVYGAGLIALAWWFMYSKLPSARLIITDRAVIFKRIATKRFELINITEIKTGGSVFQRLMGGGWIAIYAEGLFNVPFLMNGFPDPVRIKKQILRQKI